MLAVPRPTRLLALVALLAAGCGARGARTPSAAPPTPVEDAGEAVLVDKVVAVVVGRPITLSEVALEARLARAAAGGVADALAPIPREELARTLDVVLDRAAVRRALGAYYPEIDETKAAGDELARMRDRFGKAGWARFLSTLELSEDEVRERRRRALEAGAIIQARIVHRVKVDREAIAQFVIDHPEVTDRAEAERRVLEQKSAALSAEIRADARRVTSARVVDPIATPETADATEAGNATDAAGGEGAR